MSTAFRILFLVTLGALAMSGCAKNPTQEANSDVTRNEPVNTDPSHVVGGHAPEPNYRYPWVVTVESSACFGVVIHASWVLTAAHCVTEDDPLQADVVYSRTDPYTHEVKIEKKDASKVHWFPDYAHDKSDINDLALIKLSSPLAIGPYIQTAAIPVTPTRAGLEGTVAANSHTAQVPPGEYAIFRGEIPNQDFGKSFALMTTEASGSLCDGDSGSGFVTYEGGRATVRGVTDEASGDCVNSANNRVTFADVYAHRDWIFQTIGISEDVLTGNTRVRWAGDLGKGEMGLSCSNDSGYHLDLSSPIGVPGIELGMNCSKFVAIKVTCHLGESGENTIPSSAPLRINAFRLWTACPGRSPRDQMLPIASATDASYTVEAVSPFDHPFTKRCKRVFTCDTSTSRVGAP